MERVDVIGIGAINFDLIFSSLRNDSKRSQSAFDDGEERFVDKKVFNETLKRIQKASKDPVYTQVGGSALLTIRTVKSMCSQLKTAYVGVIGNSPECCKGYDLPKITDETLKHLSTYIDDMSWLFVDDTEDVGMSIVNMKNRKRQFINILSGANDTLKKHIESRQDEFIDFVSQAKWVHITSLRDTHQFVYLCALVALAKEKNPMLTISFDPGFDYTKHHWDALKKVLSIADYVFLSKSELSNIFSNVNLSEKDEMIILAEELIANEANPQVLIVKDKYKSILLSLVNKNPFVRTYYHKRLFNIRILNDTGAGDAFAGGFIAGNLMPKMMSYQPAAIQLASVAAKERLRSKEWPTTLRDKTYEFITHNMKNEKKNKKQFFQNIFDFFKKPLVEFAMGIGTGLIASWIYQHLTT